MSQVPQPCAVCDQHGCSAAHRCGAWLSQNIRCPGEAVPGTHFCVRHGGVADYVSVMYGGHDADGS